VLAVVCLKLCDACKFAKTQRISVLIFLMMYSQAALSQVWLKDPVIRVCESGRCDDEEHIDLSTSELVYAEKLLEIIQPKASEHLVASRFGRQAIHKSPPINVKWGKVTATAYRATWMVDSQAEPFAGPHVDVYFADGKACLSKWWFNGTRKRVEFHFTRFNSKCYYISS
jgi:hypothetical protein